MQVGKAWRDSLLQQTNGEWLEDTGALRYKLFSSSRRFLCFQANPSLSPAMGLQRVKGDKATSSCEKQNYSVD